MAVVTLSERKSREAARRRQCAAEAVRRLGDHARAEGGRFWVFGSYITGAMGFDSDLDVLVDFPADRAAAAWCHAEAISADLDLPIDLHDAGASKRDFVARVTTQGRAIS